MKRNNNSRKIQVFIVIAVVLIIALESVGFAYYTAGVSFLGNLTLKKDGVIKITNVELATAIGGVEKSAPVFSSDSVQVFVTYNVTELEENYEIDYDVTIDNDSSYDYTFSGQDFNAQIDVNDGSQVAVFLDDIEIGDIIPKKSAKTFTVKLVLVPKSENTNYDVTGEGETAFEDQSNASILVAIPSDSRTGDLSGSNNIAHFTVEAINGFDIAKTFTLSITNTRLVLCNSTGGALENFSLEAGEEKTFDFYVKKADGAQFPSNVERLTVSATYDDVIISTGTLAITVDPSSILDTEAPTISNVKLTQNSALNSVHVSWKGYDLTSVDHYVVQLYKSNGTKVGSDYNTSADETYMDISLATGNTNNDGDYYARVYGVDIAGNKATNTEINNATVAVGHASRSETTSVKWFAKISYEDGNYSSATPASETRLNQSVTISITKSGTGNYGTPTSLTSVSMGGKTLRSGTDYTTTSNNTTITINISNVTGDIVVTLAGGNSGCLVEGTKILLADGTYKNIEDVTYYDLLPVWDYERGVLSYEYPVWIENANESNHYRKVTFSDGTVLKFVGYHGMFSFDLNKVVSVDNPSEFYIGMNVAKLNGKKLEKVTVTNIEIIYEKVKYYHICTSKYYNIFAEDILTTDGTTMITNLFSYGDHANWINPDSEKEKTYTYDDFKDIAPYYMYYAGRMRFAYYLKQVGVSLDMFKYYLITNQLNPKMLKEVPADENGLVFKVSSTEGYDALVHENDIITIPGENSIYFNTLDNRIYESGEEYIVKYSTHFIKIKDKYEISSWK